MPTEEDINNASNLADIASLVSDCTRCPLYSTKTKDVPGGGNPNAEVMFIGEAPGRDEDLKGEPFVGAAGKFLNEMLKSIGMSREEVFIGNVLKHRPPNNRDPLPNEVEACWPYLKKQIEIISPKLIVFLGRHALNQFFPELKISAVHGTGFKKEFLGKEYNFFVVYHPVITRFKGKREVMEKDFKELLSYLITIKK